MGGGEGGEWEGGGGGEWRAGGWGGGGGGVRRESLGGRRGTGPGLTLWLVWVHLSRREAQDLPKDTRTPLKGPPGGADYWNSGRGENSLVLTPP